MIVGFYMNLANGSVNLNSLPLPSSLSTQILPLCLSTNSLQIINFLSPSILYYLDSENIYPTKFGTIIMDWEFSNNNLLSLEIAKKSIGYFMICCHIFWCHFTLSRKGEVLFNLIFVGLSLLQN